MTTVTENKPNFTQVISIEPNEMSDFCHRFELAKINLSELEPISQQENSKHNLLGVRVGYDAFYASPRFMKSLMFMFDFTENIFSYFSPA